MDCCSPSPYPTSATAWAEWASSISLREGRGGDAAAPRNRVSVRVWGPDAACGLEGGWRQAREDESQLLLSAYRGWPVRAGLCPQRHSHSAQLTRTGIERLCSTVLCLISSFKWRKKDKWHHDAAKSRTEDWDLKLDDSVTDHPLSQSVLSADHWVSVGFNSY